MEDKPQRPRLSVRRKVLFSALALVVVLGGTEVVLRFVMSEVGRATIPHQQIAYHVERGMKYDADMGWTWSRAPDSYTGLNRHGFRYEEVDQAKPAGGWRAFALGDSQTFGPGVEGPETFPLVAEASLRSDAPNSPVQFINAGVSGYTSLQVLRMVEKRLLDWDPDLFVVDSRTFDSPRDGGIGSRMPTISALIFQSRLAFVARFALERIGPRRPRPMHAEVLTEEQSRTEDFYNHDLIRDFIESRGIGLVFLTYPVSERVRGIGGPYRRKELACLSPIEELPEGADVLDCCKVLEDSEEAITDLFLDNNHFTPLGHRVIGEALAELLQAKGLGS